jgi:hypothetical protein
MTPSRPRLQYLLPKINTMASCPSRIHHQLISFFVSNPRHHALPNAFALIRGIALLPNDDVLPTADTSTECFEENLLSNGVLLPNSAHKSVSSLYQFLLLTGTPCFYEDRPWKIGQWWGHYTSLFTVGKERQAAIAHKKWGGHGLHRKQGG